MGKRNGGGNPYHDPKTGRFTTAQLQLPGIDWQSYDSKKRDREIKYNQEEAIKLNRAHAIKEIHFQKVEYINGQRYEFRHLTTEDGNRIYEIEYPDGHIQICDDHIEFGKEWKKLYK